MKHRVDESPTLQTNQVVEHKAINFGIKNFDKMISLFRNDFYTFKIQTPVQEYLCNGRDACREAKRSNIPLKVTLPTSLDSVFKIRDYGIGMSDERLTEIFVNYGSSTKEDNDEQTGGFGLGSKSFFAYTDSFIVTSFLNGVKTRYMAHLGVNRRGEMRFLDRDNTTEDNGTEIQVAVKPKDIPQFIYAAYRATMFWDVKPNFVGILPEEIPAFYKTGLTSPALGTTRWSLYKAQDLGTIFSSKGEIQSYSRFSREIIFAIDKIPYVIPRALQNSFSNVRKLAEFVDSGYSIVVDVKNGECEVNANRESIAETDFSKEQIDKICGDVVDSIREEVAKTISDVTDFTSYLHKHITTNRLIEQCIDSQFKTADYTWELDERNCLKTVSILESFQIQSFYLTEKKQKITLVKNEEETKIHFNSLDNFELYNYLFLLDTNEGPNKLRERVRNYLQGRKNQSVYILSKKPEANQESVDKMISQLQLVKVSTLLLPEVVKTEREKFDKKGKVGLHFFSYQKYGGRATLNKESFYLNLVELEQSKTTYIYFECIDGKFSMPPSEIAELGKYLETKGHKICGISPRNKMKIESFKNFISFENFRAEFSKKTELTKQEKDRIRYNTWNGLSHLDNLVKHKDKIKDPEIKNLFAFSDEMEKLDRTGETIPPQVLNTYYKNDVDLIKKELEEKNNLIIELEKKYPLLIKTSQHSYYDSDDEESSFNKINNEIVFYMNMKYEMSQKN